MLIMGTGSGDNKRGIIMSWGVFRGDVSVRYGLGFAINMPKTSQAVCFKYKYIIYQLYLSHAI